MSLDPTPLGAIGDLAQSAAKILGMIFPDKTEEERSKIAAAMALISAQTDIDKTEAQSSDPLQHWRGGLGWVCTLAYANNFLFIPWALAANIHIVPVDLGPLAILTAGMLGLTGAHVYQTVNGK